MEDGFSQPIPCEYHRSMGISLIASSDKFEQVFLLYVEPFQSAISREMRGVSVTLAYMYDRRKVLGIDVDNIDVIKWISHISNSVFKDRFCGSEDLDQYIQS